MAGVKGRSGRKPEAKQQRFDELINKCWTDESRQQVLNKLIEDCGSKLFSERNEARKLLFAYTFGKPTEKHEHSNPDGTSLLQPVAEAMVKVYGPKSSG